MDAFRADTGAHVQKHNQGNQKLDYRAFLLVETVVCWLWGGFLLLFSKYVAMSSLSISTDDDEVCRL